MKLYIIFNTLEHKKILYLNKFIKYIYTENFHLYFQLAN